MDNTENLGLFAVHKIISEDNESAYSENTQKESMRLLAYSPSTPRETKLSISRLIIVRHEIFLS
jgi:hypothetical protein